MVRLVILFAGLLLSLNCASASAHTRLQEPTNILTISAAERLWIARHPVIRVHMSDDHQPFEFREGNAWKGLANDYLREACRRLGLKIVVSNLSWPEALLSIRQREPGVDLLLTVMHSTERASQVELTRPYLVFPQVIVARKDSPFIAGIKDLAGKTIAVENGYLIASWIRRDLPSARLSHVASSVAALKLVASGSADAYVGNLAAVNYVMEKYGLTNLRIASPTHYGDEALSMGVRRDWPELVSLLDRAMDSFSPADHQHIRLTWLSAGYERGIPFHDVALWLALAVALALALIVPLRVMVARKTRELAAQKELLDAILDNTFQYQGLLSPDGTILRVNKALLAFADTDGNRVIGRKFWDTLWFSHSADERQRLREAVSKCSRGETVRYELTIVNCQGKLHHVDFSLKPLRDAAGTTIYLIPEGRDISEIIRREQALSESEERFHILFNECPMAIVLNNFNNGTFVDANRKYCELRNIDKSALIGKMPLDLEFLKQEEYQRIFQTLRERGKVEQQEYFTTAPDGSAVTYLLSASLVEINGCPYTLTMLQDITDRKQAEESLRRSEENYRNLFDNAPVGVFQSIGAGRFSKVNQAFVDILGYESIADLLDSVTDITTQVYASPSQRLTILDQIMKQGRIEVDETEFLRKDGTRFTVSLFMRAVKGADDSNLSIEGFVVDTSERKRFLDALREREERLHLYIHHLPIACILWDTDFRVQGWNPAAERLFGYPEAEALGRKAGELIIPASERIHGDKLWKYMNRYGLTASSSCENVTREDETILCEWTHTPFFDRQQHISGVLSVAQDITLRRRHERDLRESENRFRTLIEKAPIGIAMMRDWRYVYSNQAHAEIFGFDNPTEINGMQLKERIAPQALQKAIENTRAMDNNPYCASQFETIGVRKDGTNFPYFISATRLNLPDGAVYLSFGSDITERKQARELMIHNEKMTMVAGMAAGIAHEVNNPLGIISQDLQNLERRFSPILPANCTVADELSLDLKLVEAYMQRRDILNYISSMRNAVKRASSIINSMLQFSRQSNASQQLIDLNDIIDQSIRLAASDYDLRKKYDFSQVDITRDYDLHLPRVAVCITEMEQVFINILKNSAQSMHDAGTAKPSLLLRTSQEGGKILVEIRDNGPGISDAVRQRIFEPFFTTKDVGAGTGLGLSVTHAIVTRNHGGEITFESQPNQGACCKIRLPLTAKE